MAAPAATPAPEPYVPIPLAYQPPVLTSPPLELMMLRQQAKMIRQQAKAARKTERPAYKGPYLGLAYITMPEPSGDAKADRNAWNQWRAGLAGDVRRAVPQWTPEAYGELQARAIEQSTVQK